MGNEVIEEFICEDGALGGLTPYVNWEKDDDAITLDGQFSAAELRAFADHMDANREK